MENISRLNIVIFEVIYKLRFSYKLCCIIEANLDFRFPRALVGTLPTQTSSLLTLEIVLHAL